MAAHSGSWRRPRSRIVGGGRFRGGTVFCALVEMECEVCGALLAPGALFTRRRGYTRNAAAGRLLAVVCTGCAPIASDCLRVAGEDTAKEGERGAE